MLDYKLQFNDVRLQNKSDLFLFLFVILGLLIIIPGTISVFIKK